MKKNKYAPKKVVIDGGASLIQDVWWYSGRKPTVHIRFKDLEISRPLEGGGKITIPAIFPQINLTLRRK